MRRYLFILLCLFLAFGPAPATAADDLTSRLETLADTGNGEAAYHLGMIHHLGLDGRTRDPRRAFEYFRMAAERGDPLGAYKLGCFYAGQGEGVVEDDEELALRHKLVAAEAGYDLAQLDVAAIYAQRGETDEALRWLEAAAAQGDIQALGAAGAAYSGIIPQLVIRPDPVKGFAYTAVAMTRSLALSGSEGPSLTREEIEEELQKMMELTPEQLARARTIIVDWRPRTSALTEKARLGQEAAERLIRES